MTETYRERAIHSAQNPAKFEPMLKVLGNAETGAELIQMYLMFYVPDMSYDRGDICLAVKVLEKERGWGQYARSEQCSP